MRNVDLRLRSFAQAGEVNIADDPYDLAHGRSTIDSARGFDAFADRVFAGKEFLRETLRHDRDRQRVDVIVPGEIAASQQRHAQRFEKIETDDVCLHVWLLRLRDWPLF